VRGFVVSDDVGMWMLGYGCLECVGFQMVVEYVSVGISGKVSRGISELRG